MLATFVQSLREASRVTLETDVTCEHGRTGMPHDVIEGATILYKCFPGTQVWQIDQADLEGLVGDIERLMDGKDLTRQVLR